VVSDFYNPELLLLERDIMQSSDRKVHRLARKSKGKSERGRGKGEEGEIFISRKEAIFMPIDSLNRLWGDFLVVRNDYSAGCFGSGQISCS